MEILPVLVTAASPVLVVLFTWLTRRGLDRKAAETKEQVDLLTAQRETFDAIITPLQDGLAALRKENASLMERVNHLEKDTRASEHRISLLITALEASIAHLQARYGDPGPELDPRVKKMLQEVT